MSRSDPSRFGRLVQAALESDDTLSQAAELLEPVRKYDAEHNGDLLTTLRVYFREGGNASRAAHALFLHRNGLLYRLNRVEELLRASLSDETTALALQLALRVPPGSQDRRSPDPDPTR